MIVTPKGKAGTPLAVRRQLRDHLLETMRQPDVAQKLVEQGFDVLGTTPEGSRRLLFDQVEASGDTIGAVLEDLAARYPGLELWAAGFSFGSYIALTVGASDDRICALIGITENT